MVRDMNNQSKLRDARERVVYARDYLLNYDIIVPSASGTTFTLPRFHEPHYPTTGEWLAKRTRTD